LPDITIKPLQLLIEVENIMRKLSYNLGVALSLVFLAGTMTALAGGNDSKRTKIPKHMGMLSVYTLPEPAPVKVDGDVVGMSTSDRGNPAEFVLSPGVHTVEIQFADKVYTTEVEIVDGQRNCVCVKKVVKRIDRPCPYDMRVDAPAEIDEGDSVTFTAVNMAGGNPPLNYIWKVSPGNARIISGMGTNTITVDSTGLGGAPISASVDVNQGFPEDATCAQMNTVEAIVKKPPPIIDIPPIPVDEFDSVSFDDDKARFDNFAIQLLNRPDAQGYIIVYQGTGKNAQSAEKASRRALNYLTKNKGIDPRRISITSGGFHNKTRYELWVIPAGAGYPTPRPTVIK
jgi:hypothetical protein